MHAHSGPALLLGVLIVGAILREDVIASEHKGPRPHMEIAHHGVDSLDPSALSADNDRNV